MNSSARDVIDLYQRHAAAWVRNRGDRLTEGVWLGRFLGLLPEGRRVLDLGCGSGSPIARYLIGQGCAMTGVDGSADLIAVCEAAFPEHAWGVGDMRLTDLGQRFDGVLAWDSLFHLDHEDQRRMFDVFRRHCGPYAALMFNSGPAHGEAIGAFEGEPLYHASLEPSEYRSLLADQGFEVVRFTPEDPECGGRSVWLARLR
ncbi:class I SAM-dependent DNA methyltransferase [Phenylobacterium sp.]|uniref:class I SAM-dependent DNA methyltransferase n=1 Tax=Phenylobacterium sp. TaxID=1871053 RepID=UPI003001E9EC